MLKLRSMDHCDTVTFKFVEKGDKCSDGVRFPHTLAVAEEGAKILSCM